LKTFDPPK